VARRMERRHVVMDLVLGRINGFRLTNHMACGLGFDGWLFPGEPRRRR